MSKREMVNFEMALRAIITEYREKITAGELIGAMGVVKLDAYEGITNE
jgi:hypothetical protein